jgi:hypothetical protein
MKSKSRAMDVYFAFVLLMPKQLNKINDDEYNKCHTHTRVVT